MEEERTVLATEGPGATSVFLALGWRTISRGFRRNPPSPLDLENAIAAIEDEITGMQALPPQGSRVGTQDALVRKIARAAGLPVDAGRSFTIAAVEQAFQRLAAQAERDTPSADGLAPGNDAAAALVILRELMHHWGLGGVALLMGGRMP